jgi:hypothetical protein
MKKTLPVLLLLIMFFSVILSACEAGNDETPDSEYEGKFETSTELLHEDLDRISSSSSVDEVEVLCNAFIRTKEIDIEVMSELKPSEKYKEVNVLYIQAVKDFIIWAENLRSMKYDDSEEINDKVDKYLKKAYDGLNQAELLFEEAK